MRGKILAAVAAAAMFIPISASALTVIDAGEIPDGTTVVVPGSPLNLAADEYRIEAIADTVVNPASGTLTMDTYVDPYNSTGLGAANVLVGLDFSLLPPAVPAGVVATATWGTNVFSLTDSGGTGTFSALISTVFTAAGLPGKQTLKIDFSGVLPGSQISMQISAVPLPAAGWLFLAALGGMGALSRRRKALAA